MKCGSGLPAVGGLLKENLQSPKGAMPLCADNDGVLVNGEAAQGAFT